MAPNVGSENPAKGESQEVLPVSGPSMTETPGFDLTELTRTASLDITNASANAGTGGRNKTKFTDHRVTSGKTTISNTAHSIEKYPED